jgi:hypothetical protein
MDPSPHARYRERLTALADTEILRPHLEAWLARQGRASPPSWVRDYGRFRPGESTWAVLVLVAADGTTVRIGVADEPLHLSAVHDPRLGWITLSDAVDDEALPGLRGVLSQLDGHRIVRYRPGQRCTLRGALAGRTVFVKVGRLDKPRFADTRELETAAAAGLIDFAVADLLRWDDVGWSIWYACLAGRPAADDICGPHASGLAERIGAALGTLAKADLHPAVVTGPDDQLARTLRVARRATLALPSLADGIDAVLTGLARAHDHLAPRTPVPIHGSPHINQWLTGGTVLGLVDFDRYARGDAELDAATLLTELESEKDMTLPIGDVAVALRAGYASAGVVLDQERLALYRRHKQVAKVARTAYSLRPDGDLRAAAHLAAMGA